MIRKNMVILSGLFIIYGSLAAQAEMTGSYKSGSITDFRTGEQIKTKCMDYECTQTQFIYLHDGKEDHLWTLFEFSSVHVELQRLKVEIYHNKKMEDFIIANACLGDMSKQINIVCLLTGTWLIAGAADAVFTEPWIALGNAVIKGRLGTFIKKLQLGIDENITVIHPRFMGILGMLKMKQ